MHEAGTTLIVEPNPGGHRFQAAGAVASVASRAGTAVLLTSRGAQENPAFGAYLADLAAEGRIRVSEEFDDILPPTQEQARVVARWCRERPAGEPVSTVVLMDADQALKRWWLDATRHLRGVAPRPRVVFMLTRYPARLRLTDRFGWMLRVSKASLALVAMALGRLHRVAGFSGREDRAAGWLVKRVRDPHYSTAHSRDRDRWRREMCLPADRTLVGIFGVLTERKNAPLVLEAMTVAGLEADLVLAGELEAPVRAWVDGLDEADRARLVVRDEYLSNEDLDRLVAAVDVVPLALTNNGPSGIMGKAEAAGVPVVSAGSLVRARELEATGAGEAADFTAESIGAAMRRCVERGLLPDIASDDHVSPEEWAMALLGVDASGRPRRRGRGASVRA